MDYRKGGRGGGVDNATSGDDADFEMEAVEVMAVEVMRERETDSLVMEDEEMYKDMRARRYLSMMMSCKQGNHCGNQPI